VVPKGRPVPPELPPVEPPPAVPLDAVPELPESVVPLLPPELELLELPAPLDAPEVPPVSAPPLELALEVAPLDAPALLPPALAVPALPVPEAPALAPTLEALELSEEPLHAARPTQRSRNASDRRDMPGALARRVVPSGASTRLAPHGWARYTARPPDTRRIPDMKLSDLKIIVTGAARGMGAHFAQRLAEAGAKVAAGDVADDAFPALQKLGVKTRKLDVSSEGDVEAFVAWAHQELGGLNGLINNAGILRDGLLVKKDKATGEVKKLPTADWNAVIGVNLTGATFMVREVVAKMVQTDQRPGVIVNMSSVARHGNRGQSNYVSAKAALAANTVTWAREFASYGIRVGAIAPGMIETPMTQGMNQKARDALVANVPVGRIGAPEDIWLAVKFVLECDYFDGRTIDVDGGLSM
jgi:3-oxoacyl-[acyl-carrier protein] reductase